MILKFLNTEGSELQSSDVQKIVSDLINNGEVSINVYNFEDTNSPGIYITPSTNLGEVDYPGLNSPSSDYSDILLLGSNLENEYGLKVVKVENNIEEDVRFSFERGASYSNKILLPQLANLPAGSTTSITIKYSADPSIPARRFYIGVNVDDS
jgi:hypothetical protein